MTLSTRLADHFGGSGALWVLFLGTRRVRSVTLVVVPAAAALASARAARLSAAVVFAGLGAIWKSSKIGFGGLRGKRSLPLGSMYSHRPELTEKALAALDQAGQSWGLSSRTLESAMATAGRYSSSREPRPSGYPW